MLMQSSPELIKRIIDQMPMGIIITDIDRVIVYANQKMTEITGYSAEEVIGHKPNLFHSGKQDDSFYTALKEAIYQGESWKGTIINRTKANQIYWQYMTIVPIKQEEHIAYFVSFQADISEFKELKEDMEKRITELQETMIQQEQMANIGQIAAGVVHEINNPLGFVVSNFNILQEYLLTYRSILSKYHELKSIHESAEAILEELAALYKEIDFDYMEEDMDGLISDSEEGLERIVKIVKSLKMFSRVDKDSNFELYDVNEGIQSTLILANNEIKYDAKIELKLKKNLPNIQARGSQINQVWLNLIVNGAHAIRLREEKIEGLLILETDNDETYVYIRVRDNGIGIPEENLEKIFKPFFTTKPVGMGTGIGLGIVIDIVENKHKGQISVESEVGKGTTFTISLPIRQDQQEEEN